MSYAYLVDKIEQAIHCLGASHGHSAENALRAALSHAIQERDKWERREATIEVIRWPDSKGSWWVAEQRLGRGFTPLHELGRKPRDKQRAVKLADQIREERSNAHVKGS